MMVDVVIHEKLNYVNAMVFINRMENNNGGWMDEWKLGGRNVDFVEW